MMFEPTRTAGLDRLVGFVPKAGLDYARLRNFDVPGHPHVSGLSPYLRHGLIEAPEVLRAVLSQHRAAKAEKFIQEVMWRSYWKGWLERRPGVWDDYRAGLRRDLDQLACQAGLRAQWEHACLGRTEIACFDAWAQELVETGYLHNHARMWFASIWVFTLGLPWRLGADFFLRHLVDGDAASNTLGWRWVAGIQTIGKPYLASADNIARFTQARFAATPGLAAQAVAAPSAPAGVLGPVPVSDPIPAGRLALLVSEDDLSPRALGLAGPDAPIVVMRSVNARSDLAVGARAVAFAQGAVDDACARAGADRVALVSEDPAEIADWAGAQGCALVSGYVPQGPARDRLLQMPCRVAQVVAPFDASVWPYATAGFFKFKACIPGVLRELDQPRLI